MEFKSRQEAEAIIAKLLEQVAAANRSATNWKQRFEDASKWQGLWKDKYERLVRVNQRNAQGAGQPRTYATREEAMAAQGK